MDKVMIKQFYKLLGHNQQTEIRAIKSLENNKKEILNIFVSSEKEFIDTCERLNERYNLYAGVNERSFNGTSQEQVIFLGIIPIDIDCINKPASDSDLVEAGAIMMQIVQDSEINGFKKPIIIFSGNGYQLFFKIPKENITDENRNNIEAKVQEFERRLIEKYSNDKVKLDNVGDLPRIMRIAGTYNLKAQKDSKIIYDKFEDDEFLKKNIFEITLTSNKILGSLTEDLKEKINSDETIQKLFNGSLEGKPSRSEAELSLICRLIKIGLDKEQIFKVMANCKLGKWQIAPIQYRELTFKKALEIITEGKDIEKEIMAGIELPEFTLIWDKELSSYVEIDKEWIIDKLIPSCSVGVWTGKRATYKTFIALEAVYSIASGTAFANRYATKQCKVLYLDKENGIPIIQQRVKMIKKGKEIDEDYEVGFICFSNLKLDRRSDIQKIEELIRNEKPNVLFIDTYRRAISFDENDAGEVSKLFVDVLRPLVEKYKITIVLIHHDKKGGKDTPGDEMDEIRGSSDLANYADFILKNKRKGENKLILEQIKNRNAPEIQPILLSFETDNETFFKFKCEGDYKVQAKDERCAEAIILWINKNKMKQFKTSEVREKVFELGFKKMTFFYALKLLENNGIIIKINKGDYKVSEQLKLNT